MFDPVYKENRIENLNKLTPFMRKIGPKTAQEARLQGGTYGRPVEGTT